MGYSQATDLINVVLCTGRREDFSQHVLLLPPYPFLMS